MSYKLYSTKWIYAGILIFCFAFTGQPNDNNGTLLFTSSRDGNWEVYTMDADGSNQRNLSNNPKTDYALGWSPDGHYILFYSNRDGNEDIWRMDADGKNQVNLTNHSAGERAAAWSPDGKIIAFTSDRDGKEKEIYLMNMDGTNQRKLTSLASYIESLTWLKDGSGIVFTMMITEKNDSTSTTNGEIYQIDQNGKNLKRLTNKKGFDSGASFSPNTFQMAFYGPTENKKYDLFIANADGSGIRNLTSDDTEDYSPSWSPDGKWLAYTSGANGKYDIWLIHTDTKERKQLTTAPKRNETPFWKPLK